MEGGENIAEKVKVKQMCPFNKMALCEEACQAFRDGECVIIRAFEVVSKDCVIPLYKY